MTTPDPLGALLSDMTDVGRDLWEARLVSSHGGNLSVRWEEGAAITREGAMLHRLAPAEFVAVNSRGRPTSSGSAPQPSIDTPIHLAIYREVEEAQAVGHAHPVYATALSLQWGAINPPTQGGATLGRVPVISPEPEETAEAVAAELKSALAVLVRGHGVFVRGATTWETLRAISMLEEAAMVLHLSSQE